MTCEGEALKKAFDSTYLGFGASIDGDHLTPMNARLQLAASDMGDRHLEKLGDQSDIETEDPSSSGMLSCDAWK